jgi:hypothetical protein
MKNIHIYIYRYQSIGVATSASKNIGSVRVTGLMPSKIYKRFPRHVRSLALLRVGHVGPAIVNNDVGQTSKELDLGLWYPNNVTLH